jgi:glycosyltransferase involved in cell wall biosynthesis
VDARLVSGEWGGVEQVVIGLAAALSRLDDGDEQYLFLVNEGHTAWLEPYISGPSSLLIAKPPAAAFEVQKGVRATVLKIAGAAIPRQLRAAVRRRMPRPYVLPVSDGSIERASVGVMHFPMQLGFLTEVPTIYTPHDLQHLRLPQFFSRADIARREKQYRALCAQASIVVVMSTWAKDDFVAEYGLRSDKVRVVPGAATTAFYEQPTEAEMAAVHERLRLPEQFAIYPAKAWPHKNHLRLVAALKLLRDLGVEVPVVMTGNQDGSDIPVLAKARALGVADLLHFVGFVTPRDLVALYRMARMMVFPSMFEGWGLPVVEALAVGLPVACSNATCLPAVTAGAVELFEATDTAAMADAIRRVWLDEGLRERLTADGRARAADFSWDHTSRIFRACYRQLAGRELTPEDRAVLDAPPIS